jgi:hypothetical protein
MIACNIPNSNKFLWSTTFWQICLLVAASSELHARWDSTTLNIESQCTRRRCANLSKKTAPPPSQFQVEPTVTCRPPYRSVREEFHSYGSSANRCTSRLTLQLSKGKAETRKSPRITMLPNALSGSLVTRFVASKYLP